MDGLSRLVLGGSDSKIVSKNIIHHTFSLLLLVRTQWYHQNQNTDRTL